MASMSHKKNHPACYVFDMFGMFGSFLDRNWNYVFNIWNKEDKNPKCVIVPAGVWTIILGLSMITLKQDSFIGMYKYIPPNFSYLWVVWKIGRKNSYQEKWNRE